MGSYIAISAACVLFLVALIIVIKLKKFSVAGLTCLAMAFLCFVCMFVFPPYTVPDENIHFRNSYYVSNKQMFNFKDKENTLHMRKCDNEYLVNSRVSIKDQKYIRDNDYDKFFATDKEVIETNHTHINKKALPYVASGTGITVARIIGLGPYWTFQLSRMFNVAMLIAMIYFAIKITPVGKAALSAIALIPMSLHIAASTSYDNFTFGGIMLIFAYVMRFVYEKKNISWKELLILAVMIALIVPQKVVYIAVAAILLIIPKDNFAQPKLHFAFKCALGLIAVASIIILQMGHASKMLSETSVSYSDVAGYDMGYILQNPIQILKLLVNTVHMQSDFYIKSIIAFFGWFELEMPWFLVIPYIVVLLMSFMYIEEEPAPLGLAQKFYSLLLFGLAFLFIEITLLLDHTTRDSQNILGVQGRYFIPALPLLFLFVRNSMVTIKKNFYKYLIFAMSSMNCCMFIYCLAKTMV